jgi:DtxR family Mn-dependent transcriptional regulator
MAEEALSASLEDYLEAIFHIVEEKQAARAKDISRQLEVNGSSVTGALRALADRELINYAPYDIITLTPKGREWAEDVVRRHEALHDFFVRVLGVEEADAERAACDMEHAVPRSILERFIDFVEFMEVCPRAGAKWLRMFVEQCREAVDYEECRTCVDSCVQDARTRSAKTRAAKTHSARPKKHAEESPALDALAAGQRAMVVRVKAPRGAKKRMCDMGVTPGALVEVERSNAPGDAVEVKVRGHRHALSPEDAAGVAVELLQE